MLGASARLLRLGEAMAAADVSHDERMDTQILVIGAGVAGICAAIQAGRMGCDVILLEMDDVLGGNSGPNLGIHISGAHSFHPYANETGLIDELEENAAKHWAKIHTHTMHYNISRLWEAELYTALRDAGVRVLRKCYARLPVLDETGGIIAVVAEDLARFTTLRIDVRQCVIDASGDGHIAARAGASYMCGREARDVYGERSAPEQGDQVTLGSSITALVRKTDRTVPFVPPPGTPAFEPGYGYAGPDASGSCLRSHSQWDPDADFCFLWHTETGGQLDTLADEREIYEELLRQLYAVWHHIKNEAHVEEARTWELVWVSPKAGRRESRRFVGDHVLTQTEIEEGTTPDDAVGFGGYALDIHNPSGSSGTQVDIVFCSIPPLYSIPYRCLCSRNVPNLLFSSRLISTSHLAHGTTRLQRTLGTVGQAAGMAAALCVRYGCTPRQVYQDHLEELQQSLLKHDATLLGIPNRDPGDKAQSALATASSEQVHGPSRLGDLLPMDRTRGVALWDWPSRLERVEIYLRNNSSKNRRVRLSLAVYRPERRWKSHDESQAPIALSSGNRAEWGNMDRVSAFSLVAETHATLPADFEGWMAFPLEFPIETIPHDETSDESSYMLALDPCVDVLWGRDRDHYGYARRAELPERGTRYILSADTHLFRLGPRPSYGEATNVNDGWHRRYSTTPTHMWMSARGANLPQSCTLAWPEPQWLNTVQLTFDTLYRAYRDMPINREELGVAGMCVRDYDLEVWRDGKWDVVHRERGNHRRHRVHRLLERLQTTQLRLVVRATNEPGWPARVYEIRVYDEP